MTIMTNQTPFQLMCVKGRCPKSCGAPGARQRDLLKISPDCSSIRKIVYILIGWLGDKAIYTGSGSKIFTGKYSNHQKFWIKQGTREAKATARTTTAEYIRADE